MLRSITKTFVAMAGAALAALPAHAQGCALCYTQAASAGHRIIEGLRSGILVLIFPPMFICIAITVMAYKKRNKYHRVRQAGENEDLGW
jgi:hypothetical protein